MGAVLSHFRRNHHTVDPTAEELGALRVRLALKAKCNRIALFPLDEVTKFLFGGRLLEDSVPLVRRLLGHAEPLPILDTSRLFTLGRIEQACPVAVLAPCHQRARLIATARALVQAEGLISRELDVRDLAPHSSLALFDLHALHLKIKALPSSPLPRT